jgi:ubiquinone/menaquinone biosynthesis C-methylase UbiE
MPDYFEIYHHQADQYDLLVAREDYQHNLFHKLEQIIPFNGLDVVEFGAGTGRLTCMLARVVKTIRAYDISQHMLDTASENLKKTGVQNWQVQLGDHRSISAEDQSADVAISGWSMCYLVVGNGLPLSPSHINQTWQIELTKGLNEMRRVVRQDGILIIIETLGTGHETPEPPTNLDAYYRFLEAKGFQRTWVRTDYLFRNLAEAQRLTRFFFGDEMVKKIKSNEDGVQLSECTGIWWMKHGPDFSEFSE